MLSALETVPYMHCHDLDCLRRFISACFFVLRTNLTWAELGSLVPSAEAWQVCLAHQLRDCQYAIDAGDAVFAPA